MKTMTPTWQNRIGRGSRRLLLPVLLPILMGACTSEGTPESAPRRSPATTGIQQQQSPVEPARLPDEAAIRRGATIYVPIYSHIYYRSGTRTIDLTATLSIRNTDPEYPIVITTVDYYDTDGKLLQHHLQNPLQLPPLGSTRYVVADDGESGGSGANFLVEWVAENETSDPVVEAVMIGAGSAQGISFVSEGKVVRRKEAGSGE